MPDNTTPERSALNRISGAFRRIQDKRAAAAAETPAPAPSTGPAPGTPPRPRPPAPAQR